MKEKIGLYVRVSTSEQAAEGYSISEQQERLTKYCEAHGWSIFNVYKDPGYSGAKLERPALTTLIKDVKKGKLDKVLVYKLDRLSRSQKDTLYLIEDVFLANGVDFVSMTENFDTASPFGKAMIGILSVFAQLEREQIKERMQMGLSARAKEGYYHGGPYAPIGYDYIDGELIINEYEAMQVRKVWELAESGMPLYAIMVRINEMGYTHKHNTRWTPTAIRSVLTSCVYAGMVEWKGETFKGRHEAIVSPERYEKMVNYLATRDIGPYPKKPFTRHYLLTGLIFCGNCGAQYYVKTNTVKRHKTTPIDAKPNNYYTCYSRGKSAKHMIKDPTCKNKTYNVKVLDQLIKDELKKLQLDPTYFDQVSSRDEAINNADILQKRIAEIDKQITKLVDLYQIGGIDFSLINGKIATLNNEKNSLEQQMEAESEVPKLLNKKKALKQIKTFNEIVDTSDTLELRSIIDTLIDAIIIKDEDIEIIWKF